MSSAAAKRTKCKKFFGRNNSELTASRTILTGIVNDVGCTVGVGSDVTVGSAADVGVENSVGVSVGGKLGI
jgi:hypothetical protein